MALTDTYIRNSTKPSGRPTGDKHTDSGGMYLLVKPGGKYWRMDYRFAGKRRTLALGVYPAVSLAQARKRRDEARELLADGTDPSAAKRVQKIAARVAAATTFEAVARECHAVKKDGWSPNYANKWLRSLELDLFPAIGRLPLGEVSAPLLLNALKQVERRAPETAHTLRKRANLVFRYGIQTGRCERSPVPDLHGALVPITVRHMAAVLEPAKAGELMRAITMYTGQPTTRAALKLSALLFQRPGNIRQMKWADVDMDAAVWRIPAADMKRTKHGKLNSRPHIVPLAPQALAVLEDLKPLTGHGIYVFPSLLTGERPMSDNTIRTALRRLGYTNEDMTAHGFRAMARTIMVEQMNVEPDVIEAQLAHGKSGPLGAAYDRAEFVDKRRKMMMQWADYLDKLRQGADVVQLRA